MSVKFRYGNSIFYDEPIGVSALVWEEGIVTYITFANSNKRYWEDIDDTDLAVVVRLENWWVG